MVISYGCALAGGKWFAAYEEILLSDEAGSNSADGVWRYSESKTSIPAGDDGTLNYELDESDILIQIAGNSFNYEESEYYFYKENGAVTDEGQHTNVLGSGISETIGNKVYLTFLSILPEGKRTNIGAYLNEKTLLGILAAKGVMLLTDDATDNPMNYAFSKINQEPR